MLAIWAVLIGFGACSFLIVEQKLGLPDYVVYGSESARTEQLIHSEFPRLGGEQDAIHIGSERGQVDSDPALRERVDRIAEVVGRDPVVADVIGPFTGLTDAQIAQDRSSVLMVVALNGDAQERSEVSLRIQAAVDSVLADTPYRGYLTGQSPLNNALTEVEQQDQVTAEVIGLPIAFVILLLALRSLVAALVPLVVAGAGIVLSSIGILALTTVMELDSFALVVATVLGLGIGIDYALFVVGRYQEQLARGDTVADAIATSMRTSGRTVLTAGLIVVIALGSLLIMRGHIFVELPLVSAIVVLSSMAASLTLLPALLSVLGRRINALAPPVLGRRGEATRPNADGLLTRWTRVVVRHPLRAVIPAILLLILCTAPLFGIRLGLDLGMSSLQDTKPGIGAQAITDDFGSGAVSPLQMVACRRGGALDDDALRNLGTYVDNIDRDPRIKSTTSIIGALDATPGGRTKASLDHVLAAPGVGRMSRSLVGTSGRCAFIAAEPAGAVDGPDTLRVVDDLRAHEPANLAVEVGGMSAQYRDLAAETASKLPLVVGLVVLVSFCYLVVAFRSVVLPLKATILNVAATAASIGLTVGVFQFGWGEQVFDFTSAGSVQAFLPVALFAILFGLSMDYEVLIVNRIREQYRLTGDLRAAVPQAMQSSGKQVTAAAAIMASVFGSLVLADVLELKQLGFGLAIAVILDATIIRLVLVPAAMMFFGAGNWWLPAWLARWLPGEGSHG